MKNNFGISEKSYEMILSALNSYKEIDEAILFGSRAMGNFKDGSDIDIALKGNISESLLLEISSKINDQLPIPYLVDIIGYNSISNPELTKHVNDYGKILFCRSGK